MNQLIQSKNLTMFIVSALVCFGLMPKVQAVGPDTDGAIPGSNNGEGVGVLVSRTSGVWNTGTGFEALTTSLPATKIRRPVFAPCLAMSMAATTPPRAFIRFDVTGPNDLRC
jgi:hypothetical protein